jgi:hypothetical protein
MPHEGESQTITPIGDERLVAEDAQAEAETKVPGWAEDIEHTLRRINAEKQRKRSDHPGLYR